MIRIPASCSFLLSRQLTVSCYCSVLKLAMCVTELLLIRCLAMCVRCVLQTLYVAILKYAAVKCAVGFAQK